MVIKAKPHSIFLLSVLLILFLICIPSTALASTITASNLAGSDTVVEPYAFIAKWGSQGSGDGQFSYPIDVAVDSSNNVYVVDLYTNCIQKFDSNGNFITKWGSSGAEDGQFNNLRGVAVDSSGNVYVADSSNYRIQKFDSNGNFITKWGSSGTEDGQFNDPWGVAVDSSDNVYIADSSNDRIQKFDSNGNFITKWGSVGRGDGQFYYPRDIAVDSSDNVYVVEWGNHRVQKFDSNGNFITKWGSEGAENGQFSWPNSIAVDSSGNVYVSDYNHRIQKFDSNGNFITKWGSSGTEDGQFWNPTGIAVDSSGNVYVADYNHRIQKFAQIETPEPTYNPENGHYYESINVPEGITWQDAKNAAESLSYLGMKGHLVTITTQGESDFLSSNLGSNAGPWIGGYQEAGSAEPGQGWKWITGEEILPPTESGFSNWHMDTGEPNNAGDENRLEFWGDTYQWNDLNENVPQVGYVVEYEEQRLPVANFSTDVTTGNIPLSVQFTDLSENAIKWNWDFGDGNTSTVQNPTHTYSIAGNYTVNLTVSNTDGISSKLSTITVLGSVSSPEQNFSSNAPNVYAPVNVQIGNLSQNANTINWNIGSQHLGTNFSGNGQNVSAPVNIQISNASQNADTINWNIHA